MSERLVVVIMAGGAGTRFWPLSTPELPKQFMTAFGDRSFYQQAVARARTLVPESDILVVTSRAFLGLARSQAPGIPPDQVIGEPERRDTAPAVALASVLAASRWPGCMTVVMPADHVIHGKEEFRGTIAVAVERARDGALVTLGIPPTHPSTAYGYIELEPEGAQPGQPGQHARKVRRFVEKPGPEKARELAEAGLLWNSGIFVWKAETILAEIERHLPAVHGAMAPLGASFPTGTFAADLAEAFRASPTISIDYGVMEKASGVHCVPATFRWSDVGGWNAALDLLAADDDHGNRTRGKVIHDSCHGSLLLSTDPERTLLCSNLRDLVVASTEEGVLVCPRDEVDGIKPLVTRVMESGGRSPRVDHRPWGHYVILADLPDHKVKRIVVDPRQRLSLQRHRKRSEHWHVVSGTAVVTRGDEDIEVRAGESVDIPCGAWHRVRNPGRDRLVFIEVQRGTYFGEDDIERREDDYGRTETV
jgi:mannose-1-phosphate guanylyltransferase/mannose-6-phosphate isomerase